MFLSRIDDQKEDPKDEHVVQVLSGNLLSQSFDINKKPCSIKLQNNAKKPNYFQDFNLISNNSLSQRKVNDQQSSHYFKTANKANFYIESIKVCSFH